MWAEELDELTGSLTARSGSRWRGRRRRRRRRRGSEEELGSFDDPESPQHTVEPDAISAKVGPIPASATAQEEVVAEESFPASAPAPPKASASLPVPVGVPREM